jgi:radical SAM protein with 4Fe4S-binding SPASM domain
MRGALMLRLFKRTKELAVEFCERCSRVCDGGCRRTALRERALMQAWRYGARI